VNESGRKPGVVDARALIWTLVRTDFKTRYHGTFSGFVWALLKPLTMFAVLLSIFSLIFTSDPHYKLDLVLGLFLWDFFAEGTKVGLGALHAKGFLLTKARFPSWILIVASTSNALINLAIFSAAMMGYVAWSGHPVPPAAFGLYLVYQLHFYLIVLGIALAASVLFLRYRDLNQIWDLTLQAGFFVAPIIYPLGVLPEKVHALIYLWPPTPVIEFSRSVLIDGAIPSFKAHLLLSLGTAVILATGALVYRHLGSRAAEYL